MILNPAIPRLLWGRYFAQLVKLARKRLQGRFPGLRDRDNLWHLLGTITAHKAVARRQDEELRSVAVWKLEGGTDEEIAQKPGYQAHTVECRLQLIRGV